MDEEKKYLLAVIQLYYIEYKVRMTLTFFFFFFCGCEAALLLTCKFLLFRISEQHKQYRRIVIWSETFTESNHVSFSFAKLSHNLFIHLFLLDLYRLLFQGYVKIGTLS